MNPRTKIIEAILKHPAAKEFESAVKDMSYTNLICLALDLGIDTDAVIQEAVAS